MRRLLLLPVLAFAFVAAAAAKPRSAEAPAPGISERIEVRLVEVDAWATDSAGRPVLDLRQDELQLSEDGDAVDIFYFATPSDEGGGIGLSAMAPDGTPAATTVAVFLDDAHLALAHRERVARAISEALAARLPEVGGAMLVRYERALHVLVPRTSDRQRVAAALADLVRPGMSATEESLDQQQTLAAIRERQRAGIERERQGSTGGLRGQEGGEGEEAPATFDVPCSVELLRIADDYADRVEARARQTLDALAGFASAMAALPGRKVLLFVSDGVPSRPGGAAYDYVRALCDGSGVRAGLQYATDVGVSSRSLRNGQLSASVLSLAGENRQLAGAVDATVARANSSGVLVWTLGASGLEAEGNAADGARTSVPGSDSRRKAEAQDVLAALAADTGGQAVLDRNDFDAALDRLGLDLRSSYSLAFSSPRAGDGRLHAIRLETTRPGVRLRYRRSWRDASQEEELATAVTSALLYGIDRPGLGARAALVRPDGDAPGGALVLRLALPERSLVALPDADGHRQAQLRLAIGLRTQGSDPTPVRTRVLPLDIDAAARAGGGSGLIVRDIGLPALSGPTTIAVGLRDEIAGTTAILRLDVAAP